MITDSVGVRVEIRVRDESYVVRGLKTRGGWVGRRDDPIEDTREVPFRVTSETDCGL